MLSSFDLRARLLSVFILVVLIMVLPGGQGWYASIGITILFLFLSLMKSVDSRKKLNNPEFLKRLFIPLLSISWMFLFTIIIQGFTTPGHIIWEMHTFGWTVTSEGLVRGALLSSRLVLVMLLAGALAIEVSPLQLVKALESLTSPLKKIGIPVGGPIMALALALRFVPTIYEEALELRKALIARGWSEGKGLRRISAWIPLAVPLLATGLRRSDDVAATLYLRGFNPRGKRTSIYPSQWKLIDTLLLMLSFLPLPIWLLTG